MYYDRLWKVSFERELQFGSLLFLGYIHILKRFIMPSLYLLRTWYTHEIKRKFFPYDHQIRRKYFQYYITIRAKCNVEPKENTDPVDDDLVLSKYQSFYIGMCNVWYTIINIIVCSFWFPPGHYCSLPSYKCFLYVWQNKRFNKPWAFSKRKTTLDTHFSLPTLYECKCALIFIMKGTLCKNRFHRRFHHISRATRNL